MKLSKNFQEKIYNAHKANNVVTHGNYEYAIAYNAVASIHTWIIRRKMSTCGVDGKWHWLQPLDEEIK